MSRRSRYETCAGRRRAVRRAPVCAALAALCLTGCNVVDAFRERPVRIVKMVPGVNPANGGLDCWLTLEFDELPAGADPLGLRVDFRSPALAERLVYDWAYIADHDVLPPEDAPVGSGHHPATATRPDAPPAAGQRIKIRFALDARSIVADAPSPVWLEANVGFGGPAIDSERRTIEHVYSRVGSDFF